MVDRVDLAEQIHLQSLRVQLRLLRLSAFPGLVKAVVLSSAFILTETIRWWVATPIER